ncbi:unnamed protein product [Linum trigynum]|uniref:F-box domain-containing protein n=1 Tax=Linum trigynum TaxID=586398 RepID=A0AAV2FT11_9ROSI
MAAETQPDRLSALPNDILRTILIAADLDHRTAAQTSLLSRRWRDLWKSTIRQLRFETPPRHLATLRNKLRFIQFVETLLAAREAGSELTLISITANDALDPKYADVFDRICAYGSAHGVRTFQLSLRAPTREIVGSFPPDFVRLCMSLHNLDLSLVSFDLDDLRRRASHFPCLAALRLFRCELYAPPALDYEPFASLPNLKKVELIDSVFSTKNAVTVSGEQLEEITIVFSDEPHLLVTSICAPKATKLTLAGVSLSRFASVKLPSLECLDIDVWVRRPWDTTVFARLRRALYVPWEERVDADVRFLNTFHKFGRAMFVKLHPSTIERLVTMVPGLLEGAEGSPFKRMRSLELCGPEPGNREFISLVNYFFMHQCLRGAHLSKRTYVSQEGGDTSRVVIVLREDGNDD